MEKLSEKLGTIRITIQRGRREKKEIPEQWFNMPETSEHAPKEIFTKEAISLSTR
jgi:hypothetical protein